jgi:hypothetical protein
MVKDKDIGRPLADGKHFVVEYWPYTTHTVAEIIVAWRGGDGPHRSRLARWHLRLSRADLAGHSTDDVLRILVNSLVRRLESGADPADRQAQAVGSGVPLGTAGGTVTQDSLPGL